MIFNEEKLAKDLMHEAKTVGIPDGMSEPIAYKVASAVGKWATSHPVITRDDLNRRIAIELEKYSSDLAYVYKNRGKII